MAKAEHKEVLNVSKDKLFQAIVGYEGYPNFVEGCQSVDVERVSPTEAVVTYDVSMMKDITYTLRHKEDAAKGVVTWSLEESDFFTLNNGRWEIKELGKDKCEALYTLEVEFKIPIPGFMLKKLISSNLPSMVKGFATRAKEL
jgi:ribosome-associated toxin RatA of RatAB toxin-antitoxin module